MEYTVRRTVPRMQYDRLSQQQLSSFFVFISLSFMVIKYVFVTANV